MSHTPTPWRAYNATNGRILKHWRIQRDDAKQDIALISLDVPADAREQTAAHIVRCVNSHDALVEALKGLVKEIDLSKLNIRKDFSLINAHAFATKTIHQVEEA